MPSEAFLKEDDLLEVTIPITLTLVVLAVYMVLGAVLFRVWENDWTLVDGIYFAFITMSTIGLGDLVPGKDGFNKEGVVVEMVIGSFYCLIGLAILSMCLNLIHDEMIAKFHWFAVKFGLSENEDNTTPRGHEEANNLISREEETVEKVKQPIGSSQQLEAAQA